MLFTYDVRHPTVHREPLVTSLSWRQGSSHNGRCYRDFTSINLTSDCEILEQTSAHVVLSPSVSIFKNSWTVNGTKSSLQHLCNFCPHSLTTFSILLPQTIYVSLTPNTDLLMWLLLALMANPTINQWNKNKLVMRDPAATLEVAWPCQQCVRLTLHKLTTNVLALISGFSRIRATSKWSCRTGRCVLLNTPPPPRLNPPY